MQSNDLISRAAVLDAIDHERNLLIEQKRFGAEHVVVHHARRLIEEFPTVDAAPVVHGRWMEIEDSWGDCHYQCTECGEEWNLEAGTPAENNMNYCPNCGAKMDAPACGPDYCEIDKTDGGEPNG